MRKIINKFLLVILLITSAMSFVSCEAIAAQNITHNSAAGVSGNQNRPRSGTNTNTNNRPGADGNANRNTSQGVNGNQVK